MTTALDFPSTRSSSAVEVISAVTPQSFNPTAMSRSEGRPVVRSPKQLRLHRAMEELRWIGVMDEFNDAARQMNPTVTEPILITTNGTILAGFGRWRSAMFEGRHEIRCIEYPLSEDEALQFILTHHQSRCGWNAFVRIHLALTLEPKSRSCSSCGHRAMVQWLRERWAALPDVLYKGITFTMPDVLWPLFRDNPLLARALPALAAKVIQARLSAKHGLRVGVIAILHTFNGKLAFNSHVHAMVTGGGLYGSSDTWISSAYYDQDLLMGAWRRAVIALIRAALRADQLGTKMAAVEIEEMLNEQESRWWSIKIQSLKSKEHFLRYAGRYGRRPPIAQRRITDIGERTVRFWYKDKKLRRRVYVQCSLEEFIDRWAQHISERYQHAIRNFGLFGSRTLSQTSAAIFTILGQGEGHGPNLAGGRIPSNETSDTTLSSTKPAKG